VARGSENAKSQSWSCFSLTVPHVDTVSLGVFRYERKARRGISSMGQVKMHGIYAGLDTLCYDADMPWYWHVDSLLHRDEAPIWIAYDSLCEPPLPKDDTQYRRSS
jgi:hypothetical protein